MSRSVLARLTLTAIVTVCAGLVVTPARQLAARPPADLIRSLEAPNRVASQKVEEVLAKLDLKPGMVVADIGAGTGVFSRPIARAVAPGGKVYAIDIQPEVLAYLDDRAKQEQIVNITSVLALPDDAKLPAADVDVAFFNDVLHHIEHKPEYLKALTKYMKPKSRMAIVEFDDRGDPARKIEGLPMLAKTEVSGWLADLGFLPVQDFPELFPNAKWYVIYARQ